MDRLTRRALLGGAVAAGVGGLAWAARENALPLPAPVARRLADHGPDGVIPDAPLRHRPRRRVGRGRRTHATAAYAKGAHTRGYWNRVTPAAFAWLAARLTP
jgi:hypothetical protein